MRVLMVNAPSAAQLRGGDLVAMTNTAAALRSLGVEVVATVELDPDPTGFDIVHAHNLRALDTTSRQVEALSRHGVPVVLTPLYVEPSFATWGVQAVASAFGGKPEDAELERALAALAARNLTVRLPDGSEISADGRARPLPGYDDRQRAILEQVDRLLPSGVLEARSLMTQLGAVGKPFTIVPEGVDPGVFLDPDPMPFVQNHGLRDFVLQVGRIETLKNQLLLARALRGLDVQLVLIGDTRDEAYVERCRRHGPKHIWIMPPLDQSALRSAYAAAAVHALPSWLETCGLTSLEAALGRCSLVVGTGGHEAEHFRDLAEYCDPADVDSIRAAVLRALEEGPRRADRIETLRAHILEEHTWARTAEATLRGYRATLEAC